MKERRGAARRRATGIADSVAAAVRRRQQAREPRVMLYEASGEPRLLRPDVDGHDEVLATAKLIVELVGADSDDARGEERASGEDPSPEADEAAAF